ncbi:BQ2448_2755 [Microbotryum intermedium]|uniref:BQ2448_2755 protein n=1 Tax=Microbotryum intermedium TaxID=269621 RepID=A0A238FDB2_9BASI|nr:BQ2448_2755 [Microbotryum intermedium]
MPRPLFSDTFLAAQSAFEAQHLPAQLFETDWNATSKRVLDREQDSRMSLLDDIYPNQGDNDDDDIDEQEATPNDDQINSSSSSSPLLIQEIFLDPSSSEARAITLRGLTANLSPPLRVIVYCLSHAIKRQITRTRESVVDGPYVMLEVFGNKDKMLHSAVVDLRDYEDCEEQEPEDDDDDEDSEMDDENGDEDEDGFNYSIEEEEEDEEDEEEEEEEEREPNQPATTLATNEIELVDQELTPSSSSREETAWSGAREEGGWTIFERVAQPVPAMRPRPRAVTTRALSSEPEAHEQRGLGQGWAELARAQESSSAERRRSFEQAVNMIAMVDFPQE